MFANIFPKSLANLIGRTWPRHRFQTSMLALVSLPQYRERAGSVSTERRALHEDELQRAASFKMEKRQTEWLTGRLCAKQAAMHYLPEAQDTSPPLEPHQIQVSARESGRPYLDGNLPAALKQADLTLSHGAGYAVAMICDTLCGIDIQESNETLRKVQERFCNQEEVQLLEHNLPELQDLQHLTMIWTAKEAVQKALSYHHMPGFADLLLTSLEPHMTGWILEFVVNAHATRSLPRAVSVVAELYEAFGIAACVAERRLNA